MKKKLVVTAVITGLLAFGALAFRAPSPSAKPHHKNNLKVLPKDISHPQLIAIMHDFERSLGYSCGDCHARSGTDPKKLDFASDANPKKDVARKMIKMVRKINKRHFGVKGKFVANFLNAKYEVTCYTCHHGSEHPVTVAPFKKRKGHFPPGPPPRRVEKK